jgi:agmatinase
MPDGIEPVPTGKPTFLDMPRCTDLAALNADIAIVGIPFSTPYDMAASRGDCSAAPDAIRAQSLRMARYLTHYDYDFGGEIFAGRTVRIVDCGDVAMMPGAFEANNRAATSVIRTILDRGAIPFVLGGDHAIPIPVHRAYEGREPFCLVQIDAHLDWRDERNGVRDGLSSSMRRASELPWVRGMAQIGLRSVGSARQIEFEDALAYGSVLIGAQELHRNGVDAALARIPPAERYYITFDADGLDPAIAPATRALAFGGVTYDEATNLMRGIAARGTIVGFDFVEVAPTLDVAHMTSFLAARLILNTIGALAHTGQVGHPG